MNQKDLRDSFKKLSLDEEAKKRIFQKLQNEYIKETQNTPVSDQVIHPEKKRFLSRFAGRQLIAAACVISICTFVVVFGINNSMRVEKSSSSADKAGVVMESRSRDRNDRMNQEKDDIKNDSDKALAPGVQDNSANEEAVEKAPQMDVDTAEEAEEFEIDADELIFEEKTYLRIDKTWSGITFPLQPETEKINKKIGTATNLNEDQKLEFEVFSYDSYSENEVICVFQNDAYVLYGVRIME